MGDATLSEVADIEVSPEIEDLARQKFDGDIIPLRKSTFYSRATAGTRNAYRQMVISEQASNESEASPTDTTENEDG